MTSLRLIRRWGMLFLLVVLLTGCSESEERLWLKAPGWSRAQMIGNTGAGDPVSVAVDDAGQVYFLLVNADEGGARPRLLALDREAQTIWDITYEIALGRVTDPRLYWDGALLQLFWIGDYALYQAAVDRSGDLVSGPHLLSGEVAVESYAVALGAQGELIAWYAGARRAPGLYALPPGDLGGPALLVDPQGVRPDLRVDESGALHAIWAHYPPGYGDNRIYYGAYPEGRFQPGRETLMAEPSLGTASFMSGPSLGLDQERAYLFWTELTRIGLEAGKVESLYLSFPLGKPDQASPVGQLFVPSGYDLAYQASPATGLEAGERAPLASWGVSDITDLAVLNAQEAETAAAFRARVEYLGRKEQGQIGIVYFREGAPTGYQLISFSSANSLDPGLLAQGGRLYLTWMEKGDLPGFVVYFASTAPDLSQHLNRINWRDLGSLAAETAFGLLTGALLLPLALLWLIVPLAVMGLTSFMRKDEESLTNVGTLLSLIPAVILYWVSKLLVLPGMRDYVPFSAWIPFLPDWMGHPLQIGVPLGIGGAALWLAWRLTYRRERPSALFFFLLYAFIDGILTTAVYGVLFYGTL